jgi:tight adherence protein B
MEIRDKCLAALHTPHIKRVLLENSVFSIVTGWLFYKSYLAALLVFILSLLTVRRKIQTKIDNDRQFKTRAFIDLLQILRRLSASGLSMAQSFAQAKKEIEMMYSDESAWIRQELALINTRMLLEQTPVGALKELGEREAINEIVEMSSVLEVLASYGGEISVQISKLARSITERLETEQEIYQLTASKLFEQKILFYLGYAMVLLLNQTMPDMFQVLYVTLTGRAIMTAVLIIMLFGKMLGTKLARIEV